MSLDIAKGLLKQEVVEDYDDKTPYVTLLPTKEEMDIGYITIQPTDLQYMMAEPKLEPDIEEQKSPEIVKNDNCKNCNSKLTHNPNIGKDSAKPSHYCEVRQKKKKTKIIKSTPAKNKNKREYKCESCEKTFSCSSNLNKHRIVHTNIRPYECHICKKNYKHKEYIKKHILFCHKKTRRFQCDNCSKRYITKRCLRKHIISHSNTRPSIKCKSCEKSYSSIFLLNRHIKAYHSVDKVYYECDVCQKKFLFKAYLSRHFIVQHSKYRPFKCHLCPKSFKFNNYMKKHVESHSYDKVYEFNCDICKKGFLRKRGYEKHLWAHTSSFECHICEKRTSSKDYLNQHIVRKHSDERKFHCDLCVHKFKTKDDLRKHKKNKHSSLNAPVHAVEHSPLEPILIDCLNDCLKCKEI